MKKSLGVSNSVSYNYDNLTIVSFTSDKEEEVLMALLDAGIEPVEYEYEDGMINISVQYKDGLKMKEVVESIIPDVSFDVDETGWYAKDLVTLEGEDLETFNKLYGLLDEIEDVTDVYHNVKLEDN
jgi:transcriptional/translational regulatory protein YebC/TACO1